MSYSSHNGPSGPGGPGSPFSRPPREEHSRPISSPPPNGNNRGSMQQQPQRQSQQAQPGGSFGAYAPNNYRNSVMGGPGGPSVSFQVPERPVPQRNAASSESTVKKDSRAYPQMHTLDRSSSALAATNTLLSDPEAGFSGSHNANFRRKKSLVRPDRERMDPSHRQWYYRNHAANMDAIDANGRAAGFSYMPSTTGHLPQHGAAPYGSEYAALQGPGGGLSGLGMGGQGTGRLGMNPNAPNMPPGGLGRAPPPGAGGLRRGKSILGRDEDQVESGINVLKRGVSLRRRASQQHRKEVPRELDDQVRHSRIAPGPVGPWMMYCYALTICCPGPCLSVFGIKTPDQQRAFREKIGLISIVATCMAFVGFITFGFTKAVCNTKIERYNAGNVSGGSTIFYGYTYAFDSFFHAQVGPFGKNTPFNHSNPAYSEPWLTGGKDASYLFPSTGGKCTDFLKIGGSNAQPTQYFPCSTYNMNGTLDQSNSTWCHSATVSADFLRPNYPLRRGQISFDWSEISDPNRNLVVWKGSVLDLSRLNQLNANVTRPALFNSIATRNETFAGRDISSMVLRSQQDDIFDCLEEIVRVGFVDSETIGCVASKVELYVSLVFIIGVVAIKFFMAVIFGWFLSWRLGNYRNETYEERMKRAAEIEDWTADIYRPAPASYRPNAKKQRTFLPTTSRFSTAYGLANSGMANFKSRGALSEKSRSPVSRSGRMGGIGSPLGSPPSSPSLHGVRSSASLVGPGARDVNSSRRSSFSVDGGASHVQSGAMGACPFPLYNVVPQPPADYQPFNFPLAYSICMVTAYSESFEGLRTTLDSLATTDYPNSHKVLLVVADGIVKGADSDLSTPDICLSMMKDFVTDPQEVEGHSYIAVADNERRHNMAKVYAGFYDYDDETVEKSKQQRIPMVLVAKCGSPLEARSAKPGNRGKRDSQVLLMAFMQKVMFDERMTMFEYEFFNAIWRVTGVSPDHYEIVLMVDADTKVFPDSLSRMVACMVEDPEIMGLCGETKIANKAETWVTMIQVFEYYISHHQTKAFEACFGGVTCLPGCFSAYRIKAPKGPHGYWVPILANPDIVEHYSENVVDTLHKKNLLLLGEDRYLTTLMLKTFPKRKMMFVPQAVCKTIVPDTFRVLLSQRRRWINSTVHNLAELLLVNDLCGTFCFSMRFVVFMELAGTLVLPAAIAFTLYVVISSITSGNPSQNAIPLALLGVILGLPGLLIIVTSRRISYVGWMMIYLISLPIWNFVFPSYAFWHMDDFSWGATRVIQEAKHSGEAEEDVKFDPNMIVMKRWAEFERERRWRSGTHSRDSTYDIVHRSGTPERSGSTRYSVVSSDTYHSNPSGVGVNGQQEGSARLLTHQQAESADVPGRIATTGARARLDAVPLLELPAPLGPDAGSKARAASASVAAPGSISVPRPRDTMGGQHTFQSFKTPFGVEGVSSSSSSQTYGGTGSDESRNMLSSQTPSPDPNEPNGRLLTALGSNAPSSISPAPTMSSQATMSFATPAAVHNLQPSFGSVASEQRYPHLHEAQFAQGLSAEPEELMSVSESQSVHGGGAASNAGSHAGSAPWTPFQQNQRSPPPQLPRLNMQSPTRGFSLVDDGPVASPTGVRQVTRGARRMSSMTSGADNHGNGRGAGR